MKLLPACSSNAPIKMNRRMSEPSRTSSLISLNPLTRPDMKLHVQP
uniref:Uncharacterized protein n=1 Tax=Kalanchoe fedtschenkoi TaxID=63787 RepID=A0A7N0UIC1_KALFE